MEVCPFLCRPFSHPSSTFCRQLRALRLCSPFLRPPKPSILSSFPLPTVQANPLHPHLSTSTTTVELFLTLTSSSPHLGNSFLSLASLPVHSSLLSNPTHGKHLLFTFPPSHRHFYPSFLPISFHVHSLSSSSSLLHTPRLSPLQLSKPLSFPLSPF